MHALLRRSHRFLDRPLSLRSRGVILLGLAALVTKSSNSKSAAVGYTGLSLGPLSSNLYLAFR
jgi:hypothetical protein